MKKFINYLLAFVAVVILFVSCEKDPEPEPLALTVSNVSPANNAVTVAVNSTIKVEFARAIDATTISGVSLQKGQSIIAATSNVTGNSIILTPTAALEYNTVYTVVAKGVKAADGGVSSDFASSFATAKSPFLVESVTPADKGVGVKTDSKVLIKFNKKLSTASQNGTGISVVDKDNKAIETTVTYDATNTITLTPKAALYSSEAYKVVVKGATADDGSIVSDFTSSFTVEKIPFKVVSITPADGTTGVSVSSKVVIVFSKKLNASVANGMEFVLAGMNASTSVNTTYDGKLTITLTPTKVMEKNTIYSLYVSDLSPLQSADGDKLEKVMISFTTEK